MLSSHLEKIEQFFWKLQLTKNPNSWKLYKFAIFMIDHFKTKFVKLSWLVAATSRVSETFAYIVLNMSMNMKCDLKQRICIEQLNKFTNFSFHYRLFKKGWFTRWRHLAALRGMYSNCCEEIDFFTIILALHSNN